MTQQEQQRLAEMLLSIDMSSVSLGQTMLENLVDEELYLGQNLLLVWTILDIARLQINKPGWTPIVVQTQYANVAQFIWRKYRTKQGR